MFSMFSTTPNSPTRCRFFRIRCSANRLPCKTWYWARELPIPGWRRCFRPVSYTHLFTAPARNETPAGPEVTLHVLAALNQIGADVGEPVEISEDPRHRQVVVHAAGVDVYKRQSLYQREPDRSASAGSTPVARIAGHIPQRMPQPADTQKANSSVMKLTCTSSSRGMSIGAVFTRTRNPAYASSTPSVPPLSAISRLSPRTGRNNWPAPAPKARRCLLYTSLLRIAPADWRRECC